jgi:DNA-directed RNA polymerase sigma subunit (sigma70/sigma32)
MIHDLDRHYTLREIAEEFGMTTEGVRQIEKRALEKVKRALLRRFKEEELLEDK